MLPSYTLPRDGPCEATRAAIFTKLNSTRAGTTVTWTASIRRVACLHGCCSGPYLCAASLGLGLEWFVTSGVHAQGDPPGFLIPCGTLRGAREGAPAGGLSLGSAPIVSTGMPPSLLSVPLVLANGIRVTPVQGNVYVLGGTGLVFFRRCDVVPTGDIFNSNLYPVIDLEHGSSSISRVIICSAVSPSSALPPAGSRTVRGRGDAAGPNRCEWRCQRLVVETAVALIEANHLTLASVLRSDRSRISSCVRATVIQPGQGGNE